MPAVGELSVFVSAVFFGFFGYLLCCVLLDPWSSLVRVCVDGLVFLPRSACIAPPQARLYHLGASVLRAHGSLTVECLYPGDRRSCAILAWRYVPALPCWITRDTTVMVTLGHIRIRSVTPCMLLLSGRIRVVFPRSCSAESDDWVVRLTCVVILHTSPISLCACRTSTCP